MNLYLYLTPRSSLNVDTRGIVIETPAGDQVVFSPEDVARCDYLLPRPLVSISNDELTEILEETAKEAMKVRKIHNGYSLFARAAEKIKEDDFDGWTALTESWCIGGEYIEELSDILCALPCWQSQDLSETKAPTTAARHPRTR